MKKTLLIILICVGIIVGGLYYIIYLTRPTSASLVLPFQFWQSVEYSHSPRRLEIPKLDLSLRLENVSRLDNSWYDLPSEKSALGILSKEMRAGMRGSLVLGGLSVLEDGEPGPFSRLDELTVGDEIILTDTSDKSYMYIVYEVGSYDFSPQSRINLFSLAEEAYLNLIDYNFSFERNAYDTPARAVYAKLKK